MHTESAWAKLNISLDIGEKRSDGFHSMKMIMQSISLCDTIELELTEDGKITADTTLPYIPADERNLAVKAAKKYFETIDRKDLGAKMYIHKRIPVGAGMAGGSSDAAAVLRLLNRLSPDPLSAAELLGIAETVGSDVAFCVQGGTALAEGRGEILTPLGDFPSCRFVVCKPKFSISTPELFNSFDRLKTHVHPDTAGLIEALKNQSIPEICRRMYNVFEDVEDRRMKTVAEIKSRLMDGGAVGAIMTGTGSAVFGVFKDDEMDVDALVKALKAEYGFAAAAVPVNQISI